ncbi:MAG: hypothetical protein VYB19_02525 [Bacteroidota bacterium]|nr:hypothetical protein [Bacteroidota bacterium]
MIRLLFVLFCFLAFSQKEKRSFSEKIEENIEKGTLAELIPFDQKIFSKEEVSTKLLGNDFLIVNGPGNYFNILTKNGYFLGNIKTKTFNFFKYKSPLPSEFLNVQTSTTTSLQALVPLAASSNSQRTQFNNRRTYLLYPGGGILYEFFNGSINRIDSSFAQRNQYDGAFFSYNNQLYLLGGYGFWKTKSILTKFNFNSGDWDYIKTSGAAPDGISNPVFTIKNNSLYLFDFFERPQNQAPIKNPNLYSLNMETLTWERGGLINPSYIEKNNTTADRFFNLSGKVLISKMEPPNIFEIDLENNKIRRYSDNLLLYKSGGKSIVKNGTIISSVRNTSNNTNSITYYDLRDLDKNVISEEYFIRGYISFVNYLIGGGITLIIILILLWLSNDRVSKTYFISSNSLFNSLNQINLGPDEIKVILLFTKKEVVSNKEILLLFQEKGKTKDFATKRKNKSIDSLNKSFKRAFGKNIVVKEKDELDSRLTNYTLNNRIKLYKR